MERELNAMGRMLAAVQDECDLALIDTNRGRNRLLDCTARRRNSHLPYYLAVAALLACVTWVIVRLHGPAVAYQVGPDMRVGQPGEWIVAPHDAPVPLKFDDGTELRLAPTGRVRVTDLDARGATVIVEHGELHAFVRPRIGNRWRIDVGPFRVAVVGTKFDVSWEPAKERFSIRLIDGKVTVAGPIVGVERQVKTGEQLEVWVGQGESKWAKIRDVAATAAAPIMEVALPPPAAASASSADVATTQQMPAGDALAVGAVKPTADFRSLASANRYADALAEAERVGFSSLCSTAGAVDVLLLGDVARLAGNVPRAQQAYEAARQRFVGSTSARATFMLARMAQDQYGRHVEAAEYFAKYLQEAPQGPFAREAASRLIEARMNASDREGAKAAAVQYLKLYPAGPYANRAKEVIFGP